MSESTPTPPPPAETKTRKIAEQDQKIANAIGEAFTVLSIAAEDDEILALLGSRGYDAATLTDALENLHAPAQAAYDARQIALGTAANATANLATVEKQQRRGWADYREIARAAFPQDADRIALGLKGSIPSDLEKFLTSAQASYAAGKKFPYSTKLALRGYSTTTIDGEVAGLKAVAALAKVRDIAAGSAQKATATRNASAKALAAYVSEFRKVAKRSLRERPDLLTKLGL